MTQKISSVNIEATTLSSFTGPTIANVSIANSSYTLLDDTAVSNAGGYVVITGSNFTSGAQVLFGSTSACTVTFVDSTQLNVEVPTLTAGSYVVYVQNGDGSTAIKLNGITSSPIPVWSTDSTLPNQDTGVAISISLAAPSDSNVSYYLANGSSLPSGTTLAANGLFSGTITVENETTYNFTVDATDEENQDTSRSFSVTVVAGDPYYNLTTLHLNGEPPADAWISDASTNKLSLTVNGDTRPVAFSPYETVWSNYFDGTGDYLTIADNESFEMTGDFTVEAWFYMPALPGSGAFGNIISKGAAGVYQPYYIFVNSSGSLLFYSSSTGLSWNVASAVSFGTVTINQWYHVAVSRSGSSMRLFLNGNLVTTLTNSDALINNIRAVAIGGRSDGTELFTGYISNARIVKGAAVYTSDFTPSTSPLTAIENTSLLTCQSNRLIDNSTNNFTLTKNGDVTVSNFGPFTETDLVTGSGYFDGTGDYISSPYSSSTANWYSSNTTIEMWVYPFSITVSGTNAAPLQISHGQFNAATLYWSFGYNSSGRVALYYFNGGAQNVTATSGTVLVNQWNHIAMTHNNSSGEINLYLNGTLVGTGTKAGTPQSSASFPINIGVAQSTYYTGYISNVRIVNGTMIYTSTFTPPTSPLTAVANTSLLTLQNRFGENNNRFVDSSGLTNLITRAGNATQGTFSPFSQNGWSNYFDGTDNLTTPSNSAFTYGTSDFTVEGWFYFTGGVGVAGYSYLFAQGAGTGSTSLGVYVQSGVFRVWNGSAVISSTAAFVQHTWTHIAVARSGTSMRLFVNGNLEGTVTNSSDITTGSTTGISIGRWSEISDTNYITGYVSNFRAVKGTALYTSTFTPPTSPLTAVANTSLLTCQSNRLKDNSTNNFTITRVGDVSVQAFSPFKPTAEWSANTVGGSMYFDGSGDYLDVANVDTGFGSSSNFTIDFWIYPTIINSATKAIFDPRTTDASAHPLVWINTSNQVYYFTTNAARITGTTALVANRWYHVALVRNSGTTTLYLDGAVEGTPWADTVNYVSTTNFRVAQRYTSTAFNYGGYLSDLRVIKGTALYTSAFTPPTAPTTPIAGTTMLLNGTSGGIIDYTSRNNLETVGDTKLSYSVKKYGNASMYFDGTGDRIIVPSNPNYDFGTGDFTIEMWVNFTDVNSTWEAIISRAYGVAGGWRLYKNQSNNQLRWYHNTTSIVLTTGSTLANDTWAHIAVVRNSGTLTIYIDGTSRGSASDTNNYVPGVYALEIGDGVVTSSFPFQGYIDDLRITKGYARYTSNFTPPTSAFKTK